jgi:outer membrane protein OmpA-like peptidoglycan-associated protein
MDVLFSSGGTQITGVPISATPAPTAAEVGGGAVAASAASFDPNSHLTLPVDDLELTTGNPNGSDTESTGRTTITLRSDVLFAFDKSNITPRARAILRTVAARIKARAKGVVRVTGYTDSKGTDAINVPLSIARARSVVSVLAPATAGAGISFQSAGFGAGDAVAPNTYADGADDPAGRALNRRVTIAFSAKTNAKPAAPPAPPPPPPGTSTTARTVTFRIAENGGGASTYTVAVQGITRSANMIVLRMSLQCVSANQSGQSATTCATQYGLAGTLTTPPADLAVAPPTLNLVHNSANTVSAFYLQDSTGTIYAPVHDSEGVPLTTNAIGLKAGATLPVWIYYPAPPTSMTSINVFVPGGTARVSAVPITG